MNLAKLIPGLASLALLTSAHAAVHYVGNTADADVSTVIDLSVDPTGLYGGTYAPAGSLFDGSPATWTWPAADTFILQELVCITNGHLLIEAGSVVRGQPRTDASTFNPGALFIARGAKIIADGGNAQTPIIFTTASTTGAATGGRASGASPAFWDSTPKTNPQSVDVFGNWGGVVLLGKALTNVDRDGGLATGTVDQLIVGNGYGANKDTFDGARNNGTTFTGLVVGISTDDASSIEGVPETAGTSIFATGNSRFGGYEDNDNSGVLRFVSIRHGGANLASNNEINGLTLGAVGQATTLQNIEIYGNNDDGIEIFGGSPNLKNILIVGSGDDHLDLDVGFHGTVQFVAVVAGTVGTDKCGEWDGSYEAETVNGFTAVSPVVGSHAPTGCFNIYNATIVGNTGSAGGCGLNIRDQVSPRLVNSIFVNPNANPIEIDNRVGVGDDRDTLQNFKSGKAEFKGVTCFSSGAIANGVANWVAGVSNAGANATEAQVEAVLGDASRVNFFGGNNPGLAGLPTAALAATSNIDLVPNTATAGIGAVDAVLEDGLANYNAALVPVFYRGAFEPDVAPWTAGWTASAIKGLIKSTAN